jgi:hypothetical protein
MGSCRILPLRFAMTRALPAFFCATMLLSLATSSCDQVQVATAEPLRLVKTFSLLDTVKGNFDHLAIDLKRNLLFLTPEDFKAVLVLDATSGRLIQQIDGIVRPHAVWCRSDVGRLYVTDGGDGSAKFFDGETYWQTARVPLLRDADSIGYDISRNILNVDMGEVMLVKPTPC